MKSFLLLPFLSLVLLPAVRGGETIFGFETEPEMAAWKIRSGRPDSLERSPLFATSGRSSALFRSPAWKQGMDEWPSFEATPPVRDWRGFDRLVIDLTSIGEDHYSFSLLISDRKTPFRKGLSHRLDLEGRGLRRVIVPLSGFPAAVDRSDISILHFFATRPVSDMRVHLDSIVLLRPGEAPPPPPTGLAGQLAALCLEGVSAAEGAITECRESLDTLPGDKASRQSAEAELARREEKLREMRGELGKPSISLERISEIERSLASQPKLDERFLSVARFEVDFSDLGLESSAMAVGLATSMEKILPRDMPFELEVASRASLSLARGEKESFQVAVMPRGEALREVRVTVSDLRSGAGAIFPASEIDCDVVGYVKTERRPPYKVPYVGWWPDPILDFLGGVDIAPGDVQTFWIRLRAPRNQAPGLYEGTLRVAAEGVEPVEIELQARVRTFTLPAHTPLPTAITFFERKSQMGGKESWPGMKHRYADFLADYYIDYDSLYRKEGPDYEILQRLHDQGRLVAFNLGNVFNAGTKAEGFEQAIARTVERLRPAYTRARELGLLDHAYIYGFDERPAEQFAMLESSARALRKAFPEVLLMTTSYDHSFGLDSVVKTIDAWCPLTPRFDVERATRARTRNRKVWWYICCGPRNPHANWFVEYAAIEARLLMGAMTAKCRPDGFLYYSLSIWNQNHPIESGPFTDWNPVSWTTYHGDGSLLCAGPGGKPVPTLRLENYRDGLEDFAYVCILEEIIRRTEKRDESLSEKERKWLEEARAALAVPASLVRTMAEYSRDPEELYAYRNRLGELIDLSGMPDVDPWGPDFGVRGFRSR